ncbi:Dam family site-specific DNA-(adenine-N6)-methyltransferase [Alkalimonas sp. NCh-2]|uniref:Dam family site-specific DNA-(adenine-N6)-methyltransferase n=1 Tax=Alkalimonas sp. NCh-2 TaxID=3144846 RepID=UPI0031F6D2F7
MSTVINRPFLKWAGGKAKLAHRIAQVLPKARCLVEPFVGAGSIFLNTDYEHYILSDINRDLINTYQQLKDQPKAFIADAAAFFVPENNTDSRFRELKEIFNTTGDQYEKALLFIYLNRFCFNGLCRYNKNGQFNVSFGKYKAPYFPADELAFFANKLSRAELHCRSFEKAFYQMPDDCVIYCDPPYVPLSETANFTSYSADGFGAAHQRYLARLASNWQVPVVISNHDTQFTRQLYKGAEMQFFDVQRSISTNGEKREKAKEVLALFADKQEAA